MKTPKFTVSLLALLLLLPVSGQAQTTAADVIAKIMDAYGGRDVVEKIQAVCARGRIKAFAFNDAEGTYSYCVAKDRKLRVDIDYKTFAEHRVLNGGTAYVQTGDGSTQKLTEGANYLSVVYQYEQLNLPRTLLEQGNRIVYTGRELLGDKPVDVLTLKADNSQPMKIFVDAENGLITKTSTAFQSGGMPMELSANFSDFRKVGNTIFPFRFVNFAGGNKIAETLIQDYELNPPLADKTFLNP